MTSAGEFHWTKNGLLVSPFISVQPPPSVRRMASDLSVHGMAASSRFQATAAPCTGMVSAWHYRD